MTNCEKLLRRLICEFNSPLGSSVLEMMSDVDGVVEALNELYKETIEIEPQIGIKLKELSKSLKSSTSSGPKEVAINMQKTLTFLEEELHEETLGLQMRIATLLRRSLPMTGIFQSPQSGLNPTYNPAKGSMFNLSG